MKRILTMAIIFITLQLVAQTNMPSYWHTNEEINEQLIAWADAYPEITHLEIIGYSRPSSYMEAKPIYAMKISDNADVDEDEPAVFFVGQCHAEEVTGIEIVLFYMNLLLEHNTTNPYRMFIENLEIWFVPTINPSGLEVVMNMNDDSFRKTVRDNNEDGIFDYIPNPGNDIDGVDPNRNYDFGWVHGDTLYSINGDELYDYYRGPYPFSEGGTTAIKDLGDRQHFIYGINYHDSRTGNFSEKVFYPWEFKGLSNRRNPDYLICKQIGDNVAGSIVKSAGIGTYEPSASQGRIGKSTQWFYAEYGTIQLTIEVAYNQPDSSNMHDTIVKNVPGINWMLKRTMSAIIDICPMLTGHVYDAVTGEPIVAEVIIEERQSKYFTPRKTDELYGRFWRPLTQGTYTLTVQKNGYETYSQSVVVNPTSWTTRDVYLQPLDEVTFNGTMSSNGQPVDGEIIVRDVEDQTFDVVDGNFTINSWAGSHEVIFRADGYMTCVDTYDFQPGTHGLTIELSDGNVLFSEDFNDAEALSMDVDGPWQIIDELSNEGSAITDSWGGYGFYEANCDVNIATHEPVALDNYEHYNLEFMQHLYTEPDWDFAHVEVSSDQETWTEIWRDTGKKDWWSRVIIPLDEYAGQTLYFRFRLTADSPDPVLVDPGWTIDDLTITGGNYMVTDVDPSEVVPFKVVRLKPNYPNPFNPKTVFAYSVPSSAKTAEINVFNIRGQRVEKITLNKEDMERGKIFWDATGQASGVYFYRLTVDGENTKTRKACLIK